jgi:type IV secretory pathway VirB2 component (pilin)
MNKLKNIKYHIYSFLFFLIIAQKQTSFAQVLDEDLRPSTLPNAGNLPEGTSAQDFIIRTVGNIIEFIMLISGTLAVFFIVYAGLQYVLARGQDDKISEAKNNLQWIIGGLILMFFAMAIVRFVVTATLGLEEVNSL